jgi:hypothetical protein
VTVVAVTTKLETENQHRGVYCILKFVSCERVFAVGSSDSTRCHRAAGYEYFFHSTALLERTGEFSIDAASIKPSRRTICVE